MLTFDFNTTCNYNKIMRDNTKTYVIAFCDDNANDLSHAYTLVNRLTLNYDVRFELLDFINPEELIEYATQNPIDLLFLDAEMPEMHGLVAAQKLRKLQKDLKIVFLTNHDYYVYDSLIVKAHRYLHKPIKEYDVQEILDDEAKEIADVAGLFVGLYYLRFSDTLYFEADKKETIATTTTGDKVTINSGIGKVFSRLDNRFVYTHKSIIVNIQKVIAHEEESAVIKSGDQIYRVPIARRMKKAFEERYKEFLFSKFREM